MEEKKQPDGFEEIIPLGKYRNVWLVLHRDSRRIYVKKCLETFNRRVYECMMKVHNLHIPDIAACWETGDKLYVIEEYINGETLEERLNRGHRFSRKETAEIGLQLCEALACLHGQDPPVIHRDIKLSNIMISHDGIVKLIDYNAARQYEKGLTQDTRLIGTESFAAPEQFGFAQTDARTDIYGLGVVLNYLLTGQHINRATAEGAWGSIVKKCTYIDPDRRYQSADELRNAIREALEKDTSVKQEREFANGGGTGSRNSRSRRTDSRKWWPIPGFRSGHFWKMALALLGYAFIFSLGISLETKQSAGRPVVLWMDRICFMACTLFTIAVATDYGGFKEKIPFANHKNPLVRLLAYGSVWLISFIFLLLVESILVSLLKL